MESFSSRRFLPLVLILICSLLSPTFSFESKLTSNQYLEILKSHASQNSLKNGELDLATQTTVAELLVKSVIPSYLRDAILSQSDADLTASELFDLIEARILRSKASETCTEHFALFFQQIIQTLVEPVYIFNETSAWAVQMVDSWGKIPEGVLSGHVNSFGDWDECVNIRSHSSISEPFRGEYCFSYLVPPSMLGLLSNGSQQSGMNMSRKAVTPIEFLNELGNPLISQIIPSLVTCIPSSCSAEDFQQLLVSLFSPIIDRILPVVMFCETDEKPGLDAGSISMIVILSTLAATILLATIMDALLDYRKNLTHIKSKTGVRILLAFSLVTNVKKWANTSSAEGGFACIHGIRFFSTCWVLLSHTMVVITLQIPSWNIIDLNHIYEKHWSIYFILNGFFSVDTFFTMSGLLAAFSIMKALEKGKGWINPLQLYLHRFLRLTPTYGLLVGILANLYKYVGTGPVFDLTAESFEKNCRRFWWHNLLYINNLIWYDGNDDGKAMCEGESWYIANDMQFFIVCPIFMILIYRWRRIGLGALGLASLASILIPGIYAGVNELAPTSISWKYQPKNDILYNKPWHRIGPYLVGMWMGYLLFIIGKKPVKLPKVAVVGGWMLSTSVALALLLGIIPYYDPKNEDSAVGAGFYAGLSRFVWGIVICWIIFACSKGYGGWVNSFLSWKVFIPLGRLTFCVYLSSLSIQILLQVTFRQPMVFGMYYMVNLFFSHVIMCFLAGFVFTMAFESPFIVLEKLLFSSTGSQSHPQEGNSAVRVPTSLMNSEDKDTKSGPIDAKIS